MPYMWQRITHPDVLICLEASFAVCTERRQLRWTEDDYDEQLRRLAHARQHADLVVNTDDVTIPEVLEQVLAFLKSRA